MYKTRLEKQCVEFATRSSIGILTARIETGKRKLFPDRVFFVPGGKPLLVAFKQQNQTEESIKCQKSYIESMHSIGYHAIYCDSFKSFLNELKNIFNLHLSENPLP